MPTFAIPNNKTGVIAQLVEQRTENPCVPGSIPGDTTEKPSQCILRGFFVLSILYLYSTNFTLPMSRGFASGVSSA